LRSGSTYKFKIQVAESATKRCGFFFFDMIKRHLPARRDYWMSYLDHEVKDLKVQNMHLMHLLVLLSVTIVVLVGIWLTGPCSCWILVYACNIFGSLHVGRKMLECCSNSKSVPGFTKPKDLNYLSVLRIQNQSLPDIHYHNE
jgi:hypothetical protein